jgi:N-acyl-L-homoserine lactone synthetase
MIDVILPENRFAFAQALLEMHHDRKRVFVDRLGWDLPSRQSWLEVDQFDSAYAVYLISRELGTGRHQGSVRLLPSTQPHVLASLFPALCTEGVPIALALVEFALLNQTRSYSLVIEADRVPALLSVGWDVLPLGLPMSSKDRPLQALQILIAEGTLAAMRCRLGFERPVLRSPAADLRAA